MILGLQSNIPGQLSVWLFRANGDVQKKMHRQIGPGETWQLLPMVATIAGKRAADIQRIIVARGPGPFTPVRTGFVVAQTLAGIWRVPVRGIVATEALSLTEWQRIVRQRSVKPGPLRPFYGRAPNISRPRPKRVVDRRHVGRGRGRIVSK